MGIEDRTERLYYNDAYQTAFDARVLQTSGEGRRVVLDRTALYPTSGGQPHDIGRINGIEVVEVLGEPEGIVHVLAEPIAGGTVACEIDWSRRFDHMQQHTGQHLLSAVFEELFGYSTVSFHLGAESSTIDLSCSVVTTEQIAAVELRANEVVQENRAVSVTFEDAAEAAGLRKASERSGRLRIVTIEGADRSACGGTHVRATGEIGLITLRSLEKIRGNVRVEFLCGTRAVKRARADLTALTAAARHFSAALDEVPALVLVQIERAKDADKAVRRLHMEMAELLGRSLYANTLPDTRGFRRHLRRLEEGPFADALRSEANAFVAGQRAVFLAIAERPGSVLLACSADSGVHAGQLLKPLLTEFGGKGGGSAQLAQGSFTGDAAALLHRLQSALPAV